MKPERLLRAILPDVLIDNFDIVNFDKSADRFDIYLDEKKVQLKEDKTNPDIISYGFGEYRTIQDYPIRGRATYLHVRKRKWLDKSSNEIFSYDWAVCRPGGLWLGRPDPGGPVSEGTGLRIFQSGSFRVLIPGDPDDHRRCLLYTSRCV